MNDDPLKKTAWARPCRADRRNRPARRSRRKPRSRAGRQRCRSSSSSPNPRNPRRNFAEAELADLAQSIREHGIVQPVVVRPSGETGPLRDHRRRAALARGAARRADRNPGHRPRRRRPDGARTRDHRERAARRSQSGRRGAGLSAAIDEHSYTQADLGQVIGKSRSHVANTLRLLKLPDVIRDMLVDGALSAGHARTLVTADDPAGLARRIVEERLVGAPGRGAGAAAAAETTTAHARSASAPRRMPTRWRWKSCCRTSSG